MTQNDLILVGGGLANTLIALRLVDAKPRLKFLLLEKDRQLGGNHTWSFHGSDLTHTQRNWIESLIQYSWDSYEVRFPNRNRTLPGSYHSITSEHLNKLAYAKLGDRIRTGAEIADLQPDRVLLADGEQLHAQAVIDGRGPKASPNLDVRFQKFLGRIIKLETPHTVSQPIIMDATDAQQDGYRFFYTLPFSNDTLLIEDTRYSDTPDIDTAEYGDAITRYAAAHGWSIAAVLREEDGVLPITLGGDIKAFWDETGPIARSGLQAALFHPATGYSLPNAVRLADALVQISDWSASNVYRHTRAASGILWQKTGFYRMLNRMLFLAAEPQQRRHVLERFYGLNAGLIARFYAGQNTGLDKLRILSGKPPVKLGQAYQAVFAYSADGPS